MPLENLLKKINTKKEKKEAIVKYILNLIENDYENFKNAFKGNLSKEELYKKTKKLIKELEKNKEDIKKGIQFDSSWAYSPEKELGWVEYGKKYPLLGRDEKPMILYQVLLTKKGEQIIKGYMQSKEMKKEFLDLL